MLLDGQSALVARHLGQDRGPEIVRSIGEEAYVVAFLPVREFRSGGQFLGDGCKRFVMLGAALSVETNCLDRPVFTSTGSAIDVLHKVMQRSDGFRVRQE